MHLCRKTGCNCHPGVPVPPQQVLPARALPRLPRTCCPRCPSAVCVGRGPRRLGRTTALPHLRSAVLPSPRHRGAPPVSWSGAGVGTHFPGCGRAAGHHRRCRGRWLWRCGTPDAGGCHRCLCQRAGGICKAVQARWELGFPGLSRQSRHPQPCLGPTSYRWRWVVKHPGRSQPLRCLGASGDG